MPSLLLNPRVTFCRHIRHVIALPLLLLAPLLVVFPVSQVSAADDARAKAAELEQLRKKINTLRESLEGDRGQQSALRQQLKTSERQIGDINRTLHTLRGQLKEQNRDLEAMQQRREQQEKSLAEQQGVLGQQMRAGYALGRQSYLKLLLSQQNPATVGRTLTYYDYMNRARSEHITRISAGLTELRTLQQDIGRKKDLVQDLYDKQRLQKRELEKSVAERREVLSRLGKEIQGKEARLKQLTDDEKQLGKLVTELQRALKNMPGGLSGRKFAGLKGKLYWPVNGRISSKFGRPRPPGKMKWNGVLINAREGAEVRNIAPGRVVFAEWLRGFGLLMIIDHGNGYMSLYGHNQSLYKDVGDWVEEGEVIAAVGNSGGRDTTALYFEVRHNGVPENPALWCRSQRG